MLSRFRSRIPALLAFALLAAQVVMPWTVAWFATEDGPSHLYSAVVARDLVLHHGHTHYAAVYQINRRIVPNWTETILLAAIEALVGTDYAEKVMVSLCLCAGFFAFAYAVRSFAPHAGQWTPLANFLLQNWFLWIGFYNFYLAMMLGLVAVGYYVRGECVLTVRRAVVLGAGLLAVFFTQLVGAAVACVTVGVVAFWVHAVVPVPRRWRQVGAAALAMLPVLVLALVFAGSAPHVDAHNDWLGALLAFPLHAFATAAGLSGGQLYVWPAVLSYMVASVLLMTRAEWRSPRGALAIAMLALFVLFVAIPDSGMGGDIVKVRFSWGVFLLGALLASTVRALRRFQFPMAVYVAGFLIGNLVVTAQTLSDSSDLIGDYLNAAGSPPPGVGMLRYRYRTPDLPARYAIEGLGRDPLFHLDALIAARCRCIDLSDYEALSQVFPIAFQPGVDRGLQFALWGLEGPGENASEQLDWLRARLPVPIGYVVVVADASSPPNGRDKLSANLAGSGLVVLSGPRKDAFVHWYGRAR